MSPRDAVPPEVPARPEEIRTALRALAIRPARRLGQSFLADAFVADAEAALVGTAPGEKVVEIGGGLGLLTQALLRRGVRPLCVLERDARLSNHLRRVFGDRIEVVDGDARRFPIGRDVGVVVGNLPYGAATVILLHLFESRVPRIVAMVQREVAERLSARPGTKAFGRLTLAAELYGRVERFLPVGPDSFEPSPAVESQVIVFTTRPGPLPVRSVPQFDRVVRILFSSRRKQLGNLLPRLTPQPQATASSAGWPPDWARRRPEELPTEAFFRIANVLHESAGG